MTCCSQDTKRSIIKYHFALCLSERKEKNKTNKWRKEISCFSNRTRYRVGKKQFHPSPSERPSQPSPLKATRTAKPSSIKMKNNVSGFLWNEPIVPSEAWREERDEGLLELSHLFEMVDASGSGNEKTAPATDEGCPWGEASSSQDCGRCQSALTASRFSCHGLAASLSLALTAVSLGVAGGSFWDSREREGRRVGSCFSEADGSWLGSALSSSLILAGHCPSACLGFLLRKRQGWARSVVLHLGGARPEHHRS